MTARSAGIDFDNVFYSRSADVLYLHVGSPATAVDFDETPQGHATRYDREGALVGVTVVGAQRALAAGEEIVVDGLVAVDTATLAAAIA